MILTIALKELYHNITTPRFVTGFLLCLLLIPFSIVISIYEYQSKVNVYEIEKKKAEEENQARVYSAYRPVIVKEPTPMSIFARGISYNVGDRIKVLFGDKPMMTEGKAESRDNPFLNRFFTFDFVSVLIIIISLMAFLFTYDICTGERESGTLKILLSNPVSRSTVLSGKMLGTLLTLLPMLLFSFGLCLLVIMLNLSMHFTAADWARIGLIFLYSILFLAVFMTIGLFVSSRTRNSGTSMVICLVLWVIFLFLIPNLANYSASSFLKLGSAENLNYEISAVKKEFENKVADFNKTLPQPDWGMTSYYWQSNDGFLMIGGASKSFFEKTIKSNEYSEPLRIQYADKKWQFRKAYLDKLEKQQKVSEYLAFLSPSEIFKGTVAALCKTNYASHADFLEQVRVYRDQLVDYYNKNHLFGSTRYFTQIKEENFMTADEIVRYETKGLCKDLAEFDTKYNGDWKYLTQPVPNCNVFEWKPMDLSALPVFNYAKPSVIADVRNSLIRFGVLLVLAILLYYFSFLSFIRYDVR